jgi:DNA invertase Pin-like site-specific DNA recombinase
MGSSKTKAAIYCRKSSRDDREGENRSITGQRKDCEELANRLGYEIVHVYEEAVGTSASHIKNHARPQMERALADIGDKYSVLIVWALDRLTRKGMGEIGTILERLEETDGSIVSVSDGVDTSDEHTRLLLAIKSEMARDEIAKMTKRVHRGKIQQRERGESTGGRPAYGWMKDDTAEYGYKVDPDAQKCIQGMVDLILDGAKIADAARWADEQGYRKSSGARFTSNGMHKFLRSPHLLGHRYYSQSDTTFSDDDGKPIQVTEPVISEKDFYSIQKKIPKMKMNRRTYKKEDPTPFFGLTRCSGCGNRLYFKKRQDRKQPEVSRARPSHGNSVAKDDMYAVCRKDGCSKKAVAYYGEFHDYVVTHALMFVGTLEAGSGILEEVSRRWLGTSNPEMAGLRASLEDRISVLQGKLSELMADYYDSENIDRDTFDRLKENLEANISEVKEDMGSLPDIAPNLGAILDLAQFADDPEASLVSEDSAWAQLSIEDQHAVLKCLIDEVVLTKGEGNRGVRVPVEERIEIKFVTESNVLEIAERPDREYAPDKELAMSA